MTCRDRNRIALEGDLLGAAAVGIENILMMRGDDPDAGDQPGAKPVFDLDVIELMQVAVGIRDRGLLSSGREVDGPASFFLGAADMPIDPPPSWNPDRLREKIEAGAEFAQTQICMDAGVIRRYAARLIDEGLGERLKLIVGVAVPASAKSARWMRDKLFGVMIPDVLVSRLEGAGDEQAEARRACGELIRELADIPGVAGAHVMAPLNEASIPMAIEQSGVWRRRG
jgi:methylenetetrahydrofolate reductase (NADPH)